MCLIDATLFDRRDFVLFGRLLLDVAPSIVPANLEVARTQFPPLHRQVFDTVDISLITCEHASGMPKVGALFCI